MISIKRPPAPAFLAKTDGKWQKETTNAIDHYVSNKKGAFSFKAYNDPALKAELKKFFPKCAYCESVYGAVYDGDIEHFRPKGKVSEKDPQTPGYYWLANDWENLLLSCQHCNQRRMHQLEDDATLRAYGKLDQFPLSDETKRVTSHLESISEEEAHRLLLNPCVDKPERHFEYDRSEGVIRSPTPEGTASIRVYALQRPLLVQERKKVLIVLFTQMERVKRELERYAHDPTANQKSILDDELSVLLGSTRENAPYAGMCRFFVRQFLKENDLAP